MSEPLLLILEAADRPIGINTLFSIWLKLRPNEPWPLVRLIDAGLVTREQNAVRATGRVRSVKEALTQAEVPLSTAEIYERCRGTSDELRKETWELINCHFARLTLDFKIERVK